MTGRHADRQFDEIPVSLHTQWQNKKHHETTISFHSNQVKVTKQKINLIPATFCTTTTNNIGITIL